MPNLWAICVMQAFQKAEAASPKSHGNNGNSAIPNVFAYCWVGFRAVKWSVDCFAGGWSYHRKALEIMFCYYNHHMSLAKKTHQPRTSHFNSGENPGFGVQICGSFNVARCQCPLPFHERLPTWGLMGMHSLSFGLEILKSWQNTKRKLTEHFR